MKYQHTIELSNNQDEAMQTLALKAGKTVNQILAEQVEEKVMGQVRQWIKDELKTEIDKSDPATILTLIKG